MDPPLSAQALAAGQQLPLEALRQALPEDPTLSLKARWCQGLLPKPHPPRTPARSQPLSQGRDGQTARRPWPSSPRPAPRATPGARCTLRQEARDRLGGPRGHQTRSPSTPSRPRRAFYRDQPFLEDAVHRGGLRFPFGASAESSLNGSEIGSCAPIASAGAFSTGITQPIPPRGVADPQGSAEAFYELSWLQLSRAELLPAVDRLTLRVTSLSPCEGPAKTSSKAPSAAPETPQTLLSRLARLGKTAARGSHPGRSSTRTQHHHPSPSLHHKPPRLQEPGRGECPRSPALRRCQLAPQPPAPLAPPPPPAPLRRSPSFATGQGLQLRQGPERPPLRLVGPHCRGPRHAPGLLGS